MMQRWLGHRDDSPDRSCEKRGPNARRASATRQGIQLDLEKWSSEARRRSVDVNDHDRRQHSAREIYSSSQPGGQDFSRGHGNHGQPSESRMSRSSVITRGLLESYELLATQEVEESEAVDYPGACRKFAKDLLASWSFQVFTGALIVLNALVIGCETNEAGVLIWDLAEQALLSFFLFELILRFWVLGPMRFFSYQSSEFVWNIFDLAVVGLGLVDAVLEVVIDTEGNSFHGYPTLFRVVRLLRILRLFRLIRFLRRLYILAYGFSLAAVAVFWVACLMAGALYFCSIILVRTLGRLPEGDVDKEFYEVRFGSIGQAMFSLFQLAVQPNLEEYHSRFVERPVFAGFLVMFVIFGSFGMIALLTGVISEAMFEKNIMRLEDQRTEREVMRKNIVQACTDMFDETDRNEDDEALTEELNKLVPRIAHIFEENNVPFTRHDLSTMIELMDTDASGAINRAEFCRGILQVAEEVRPMLIMELHYDSLNYIKGQTAMLRQHVHDKQAAMLEEQRQMLAEMFRELRREVIAEGGASASGASCSSFSPSSPGDMGATVKRIDKNVSELQGTVFSLCGRVEELVGDAHGEKLASQLAELSTRRRCENLQGYTAVARTSASAASSADAVGGDGGGGGRSSSSAPVEPAWGIGAGSVFGDISSALSGLRSEMQALQGGLFSLSNRMEEVVSDCMSERYQSTVQELAVHRQRAESEATVAQRMGQCEFAMLQATGAVKQLEERTRGLAGQVFSLEESQRKLLEVPSTRATTPITLSRSHSLTTSEGRSRTGSYKPEDGHRPSGGGMGAGGGGSATYSRSGSRDSRSTGRGAGGGGGEGREAQFNRSLSTGSHNGALNMHLPVVSEVGSREGERGR